MGKLYLCLFTSGLSADSVVPATLVVCDDVVFTGQSEREIAHESALLQ